MHIWPAPSLPEAAPAERFHISTNLKSAWLPGAMGMIQKDIYRMTVTSQLLMKSSSKIHPITYFILRVSYLMFSCPVSKHRKAGFQNLLKGKIFRRELYSRTLFLIFLLISYVLQYIFFTIVLTVKSYKKFHIKKGKRKKE